VPVHILRRAAQHWDEQANLRLSLLVSRDRSWLNTVEPTETPEPSAGDPVALMTALWSFIYSDRYQDFAEREVERAWNAVQDESMRLVFIEHLDESDIDTIRHALAASPSNRKTVIFESRYSVICQLNFESAELQRLFEQLRRASNSHERHERIVALFREAVEVTAKAQGKSPGLLSEYFLFMGFMLAVQERWHEALRFARRARELRLGTEQPSQEFDYFIALAARKSAQLEDEHQASLGLLQEAYAAADATVNVDASDPRFLKERGTTALRYWLAVGAKRLFEEENSSSLPGASWVPCAWEQAREDLERALVGASDPRLRLELLNNLAYLSLHDDGDEGLQEAERYIDDLLETATKDRASIFPLAHDTIALVEAKRGYVDQKRDAVIEARKKITELLDSGDLSAGEEKGLRRSLEQTRLMLERW
jgi:hypothetical protein